MSTFYFVILLTIIGFERKNSIFRLVFTFSVTITKGTITQIYICVKISSF